MIDFHINMPPGFDLIFFLKKNDGASFNCICRLPPSLAIPTSVLGFKSSVCMKRVGYLQILCFHVGFLEFQSHSKNHFDCPIRVMPHQCFGLQVFVGKGWLFTKIVFM